MRGFLNTLFLATVTSTCLSTFAVSAPLAEAWLCEMKTVDRTGWISRRVEFHLAADGSGQVFDSVISEVFGHPILAEISENSGNRLKLKWTVRNLRVDASTTISRPQYSAFLNRATKRVTVSAFVALVDMPLVGWGKCIAKAPNAKFDPTSAPRRRIVIEVPEL